MTLLFADICEFDSVVSTCGEKIVDILDDVFRGFDHLCKRHGIQKIEVIYSNKTVGKTYMACGGLKMIEKDLSSHLNKNFTQRVVDLAQEMMKYIHNTTFAYGIKLNLKIGVHYGPCIYGVIGYHKPQFSLIGDTVNTTSRHCTTGETGTIILSSAAKQKIDTSSIVHFKTSIVHMKGKGKVEVFMILPPKKNYFHLETYREHNGSATEGGLYKGVPISDSKRRATVIVGKGLEKPLDKRTEMLGERVIPTVK